MIVCASIVVVVEGLSVLNADAHSLKNCLKIYVDRAGIEPTQIYPSMRLQKGLLSRPSRQIYTENDTSDIIYLFIIFTHLK